MLQAADHELCQDHHSSPPHPCTAVHHDGRVAGVAAVQHAVGVPTHRLDLLQVSCRGKKQARLQTSTSLNGKVRRGGGKSVEKLFSVKVAITYVFYSIIIILARVH